LRNKFQYCDTMAATNRRVNMNTHSKAFLLSALLAFSTAAHAQPSQSGLQPMVPRGDGSGPATPSLEPAAGDARGSGAVRAATEGVEQKALDEAAEAAKSDAAASVADTPPGASTPATGGSPAASAAANAKTAVPGTSAPRRVAHPIPSKEAPPERTLPLRARLLGDDVPPGKPPAEIEKGTAILDTTNLAKKIRSIPFNQRDSSLDELENRLDSTDRELNEIRETAPRLSGAARSRFNKTMKDFKARRRSLSSGLSQARRVGPGEWEKMRESLATEFEAYFVALTRAEVSSRGAP
jgi:hypothetical protein